MGVDTQKERKMKRSGKKGTTAMKKQTIVQNTVLKLYNFIIQGIYLNRNIFRPSAYSEHPWDNCHYEHSYFSSLHEYWESF